MRHATRRTGLLAATILVIPLLKTACVQPDAHQLLAATSFAVLDPGRTCEALRAGFGLDHLPLVETPDEAGLPYEEHFVTTANGQDLRVWYIPAEQDRGVVIVSPGAAASMPCYLFINTLLYTNGWSAVIYDYQGYGGSTGKPDFNSLRVDLNAVLDWTLAYTDRPSATLYGMSLGSLPAIAVGVSRPGIVNGVVLDSPVALREEFERFDFFFNGQQEDVLALLDPLLDSSRAIADLTVPLMIYAHTEDFVTPPENAQLLFDAARGPKALVSFSGLDHAQSQFHFPDVYMSLLEEFLVDVHADPLVAGQ